MTQPLPVQRVTDAGAGLSRRGTLGLLIASVLAGCDALPRSAPLASDLVTADAAGTLEGLVIPLTADVAARSSRPPQRSFPAAFVTSGEIDPDRLGVDDELEITIWESGERGIFGGDTGMSRLPGVRVDADGSVYVPFVGAVRAAGGTVGDLRARIRTALEPLTLSPQVDVRLASAPSRTVVVQGAVARPGRFTLERGNARLAPLLALAGGTSLPPEQALVTIRRGDEIVEAVLQDIFADPRLDVALRPRDMVVILPLRERLVVLGATSIQAELPFPTRSFSLLSAIGAARGLRDFDADPTGVFVFRREDRALADALLPGPEPAGLPGGVGRAVVYRLDLTAPEALFVARSFLMRDGDALLSANAPLTEFRKFVQLFSLVVSPARSLDALAQ